MFWFWDAVTGGIIVAVTWDSLTGVGNTTIVSATTTDIGASTTPGVIISGTTTITGLGTVAAGALRIVKFSGALTLTHNATSLILPGGANIATAANDMALMQSLGSGNWIVVDYKKQSGQPLATVAAASGGTGQFSYTVGDLLYADTTTTLAKLADAATGNALISGGAGVAPSYGKISLTTTVSGTLQAAQMLALTGDVTNSAGAVATTIADNAITTAKIADANVTYGKIQNISTDKLLGRSTAGAGVVQEITCPAFGRSLIAASAASVVSALLASQLHGILVGTATVVFNSTNYVNIFLTPNDGSNFIYTHLAMEVVAATTPVGVSAGVIAMGRTASGYSDDIFTFLPASGFSAVGNCFGYNFPADGNGRSATPANTQIKVGCGTPITSGSITILFKLYGRYLG